MSQTDIETEQYFSVVTKAGASLEAAAKANGLPIKLTHVAVGDANGDEYAPDENQTELVHEVLRRPIDSRWQDEEDKNIAWLSMIIPADIGGFWIREFGIYAEPLEQDGEPVLYAIGNHAPYYKPEKILGQSTSHEIAIPIVMSGTANIQIMVKDMGYAAQSTVNGMLASISELVQTDASYGLRLESLEAFKETIKEATLEAIGLMKPDGATIEIKPDGTISVNIGAIDHLGEFRFFWHPTLKPGYMPCYGGVIQNCENKYPAIWQYLQTEEGKLLCVTEEEFQARTHANWYTLANGTVIGWNGIGGCARFVQDLGAGTLRMPDIRGCLPEAVGGPASPGTGACMGDAARQVTGSFFPHAHVENAPLINYPDGAFYPNDAASSMRAISYSAMTTTQSFKSKILFNSGRMVPIASVNRPRSFGVIPCAYLGQPAPEPEEESE